MPSGKDQSKKDKGPSQKSRAIGKHIEVTDADGTTYLMPFEEDYSVAEGILFGGPQVSKQTVEFHKQLSILTIKEKHPSLGGAGIPGTPEVVPGGPPPGQGGTAPPGKTVVPAPQRLSGAPGPGPWKSVALFCNLDPGAAKPGGYASTSVSDARAWLDEGSNPESPPLGEFLENYWYTLSYGQLYFGINTLRDTAGSPMIVQLPADSAGVWGGNPKQWPEIIDVIINQHAEAIWNAAGALHFNEEDGSQSRWIPSVVLVRNWDSIPQANFGSFLREVDGETYRIGDRCTVIYRLEPTDYDDDGVRDAPGRHGWGTLLHEYAHNFFEFGDIYGPTGCIGYWDLLGDNSPPGRTSEVASVHKERIGWIQFKGVLSGPQFPKTSLSLQPYTLTGEAFKVIPDPVHNPDEYFVLEYRKSLGSEIWVPDGGLTEEGLLIMHFNHRLGTPPGMWALHDCPYFDPIYADLSDSGASQWTGYMHLDRKALYPQPGQDAFTASTNPSSDFYGGRPSGLSITNIRLVDQPSGREVAFDLEMTGSTEIGWVVNQNHKAVPGRFTPESLTDGEEIFFHSHGAAALAVTRTRQWLIRARQANAIGGWQFGPDDRALALDLDGDGLDEVFIRNTDAAAVFKWNGSGFAALAKVDDRIGAWNLGSGDWEISADLDGDGQEEILIRSNNWVGVLKWVNGALEVTSIQQGSAGGWPLAAGDRLFRGRISRPDRDQVLVGSAGPDGTVRLVEWDPVAGGMREAWNSIGTAGVAPLEAQTVVADLDGDGLDEVFSVWAGGGKLLAWDAGALERRWSGTFAHELNAEGIKVGRGTRRVVFYENSRIYAGPVVPMSGGAPRAGVIVRGMDPAALENHVSILTLEENLADGLQMRVRYHQATRAAAHPDGEQKIAGRLLLDPGDRFVLGVFRRRGDDPARSTITDPLDYEADDQVDIFMYGNGRTATLSVNHIEFRPREKPGEFRQEFGLTWVGTGNLMWAA